MCLTADEWDAAQSKIDWNLEAEFGFSPGDCRMCYGYDVSKSLFRRVKEGKKIKNIIKEQGNGESSGKGKKQRMSKVKK